MSFSPSEERVFLKEFYGHHSDNEYSLDNEELKDLMRVKGKLTQMLIGDFAYVDAAAQPCGEMILRSVGEAGERSRLADGAAGCSIELTLDGRRQMLALDVEAFEDKSAASARLEMRASPKAGQFEVIEDDESVALAPGLMADARLKWQEVEMLEECEDEGDQYSTASCLYDWWLQASKERCGCLPPFTACSGQQVEDDDQREECHGAGMTCYQKINRTIASMNVCRPPCRRMELEWTGAGAAWPLPDELLLDETLRCALATKLRGLCLEGSQRHEIFRINQPLVAEQCVALTVDECPSVDEAEVMALLKDYAAANVAVVQLSSAPKGLKLTAYRQLDVTTMVTRVGIILAILLGFNCLSLPELLVQCCRSGCGRRADVEARDGAEDDEGDEVIG